MPIDCKFTNPPTTAGVFAVDDQPLWCSTGQPKCCYLLYRGQAAGLIFHPLRASPGVSGRLRAPLVVSRAHSGSLGVIRREFRTQQNSIIFGLLRKRCSYAGERPKMAPQVPQSAQLAYSLDNLMVFEPSRAPLEPSGCEPDHFKALKPDQNGRRGGQIALLDGKKTKSDGTKGHFTCI